MPTTTKEALVLAHEGMTLARQRGRPTFKAVSTTRNEVSAHYAASKTTHDSFPLGDRFGFAAAVMKPAKYIRLHNAVVPNVNDELDDAWEFTSPTRPPSYNASIISTTADTTRRKKESAHTEKISQHEVFQGLEQVFKARIEDAYDAVWLRTIKDDVLGFSHITVQDMFEHLEQQCLAINDVDKAKKLRETHVEWDKNDDIVTYFDALDRMENALEDDYGIEWPTEMKIITAMEAMYSSTMFTKAEMREWETKPAADKTWVHLQTFFSDLYDQNQKYNGNTAGGLGYGESANNVDEQEESGRVIVDAMKEVAIAATADKEHIQQMSTTADNLVAIIKRQQSTIEAQTTQLATLTANVGKLTDALAKLSAPSTAARRRGGRSGDRAPTGNEREERVEKVGPHKCAVCAATWYPTEDCWELEKNKDKQREGWTSKFGK
jgi:hypothetical protein